MKLSTMPASAQEQPTITGRPFNGHRGCSGQHLADDLPVLYLTEVGAIEREATANEAPARSIRP